MQRGSPLVLCLAKGPDVDLDTSYLMIYGLYQSATGVMANTYRQDVIANNLANVETIGFKRDVTSFQQRLTAAEELGKFRQSNPVLDHIGGGLLVAPNSIDFTQADFEATGNPLDLAIEGRGYLMVQQRDGQLRLTRDGRLRMDAEGFLTLANGTGQRVLDVDREPIQLDPLSPAPVAIGAYGEITQGGEPVAQLAVLDVGDRDLLVKTGGNLFRYFGDPKRLVPAPARTRANFLERSNADPTNELVALMDAQRQLEANANMIRHQDATLAKLVNEVGKIS